MTLDKLQSFFHGRGRLDESHRRIEVLQATKVVHRCELLSLFSAAANQHDVILWLHFVLHEMRSEIASRTDFDAHAFDGAQEIREEAAVEQHILGISVKAAKMRVVV